MFKSFTFIFCALFIFTASPLCFAQRVEPKNNCPIILVHGYGGWGPEELGGYRYWGGLFDIQAFLQHFGYTVYVAHVGPFSSNWDRAIELFYQIKGGQVDYGTEHCRLYGHIQKPEGKEYTSPFYPQWDAQHPVHLVGHSMGGQTIRMLSALLAGKAGEFQNVLCNADGVPITQGEGWIKSMTTIAAPHNGSSLFDLTENPDGIAKLILHVAGVEMTGIIPEDFLDFDLEQWDIARGDNETTEEYIKRIFETLGETQDFAVRELSTQGAQKFNTSVNAATEDAGAYRFSYATEETVGQPYTDATVYVPDLGMNSIFLDDSRIIGASPLSTDLLDIGTQWRENDGLVNTASMKAPQTGCTDTYVDYNGTPQKGVWNYMGKYHWDHLDILGHTQTTPLEVKKIGTFYLSLAELLYSLE